ncbi:MAG: peroxidase [Nitrospira sp.]|nr:peroxidase [bacterium]MBL7049955.1 peroxidase [Nitrospira sp.]
MESHEPDLREEINDQDKVLQIQEDYTKVDFDAPTRGLLDYAVKLTLEVKGMTGSDIETLKGHGFTDTDILDAVHLISYFNFINRVLDALGAEPEPDMRYGIEVRPR